MKISIELNNLAKSPVKKTFLRSVLRATLELAGIERAGKNKISVEFAFLDKDEMEKINRRWRKKNGPTDVLSFCEYKNRKDLEKDAGGDLLLGEIILCYNHIVDYSKKNNLDLQKELARAVSHGILHLLGFRHSKKMFEIQNLVAAA